VGGAVGDWVHGVLRHTVIESRERRAGIALDAGYESEAALSRAFKRSTGMPPAAWRRTQASELQAA